MARPIVPNPPLAVGLMLTACLFIAGSTLMAKLAGTDTLGEPLHPLQVSHGRFLFAWMLVASLAVVMRLRIRQPNLKLHALRTLSGWGGVSLMFAAVAFIPMADATAISFLNPVFAMMLAIPLLGERVGPVRWAAAGIALIGALVLLRPTPASFQPAALLALAAAVVMGLEITLIKLLSGREGPLQILFINNSLGLIIASLAVIPVWAIPSPEQWMALVGVGILMALAQMAYVNAMARAEASLVAPFAYATLIFAAAFDTAVFARLPDTITVLGAAIIIAGAALLAWRETRAARLARRNG
ncbi:DMT family transporter [Alisedimentitalea sp. MJ-SS2]|uniref:DMT family transporter n=1 Tax=Aliisedimentitalea sp. MJ-SS2 TaxID=3049795 RepID=UPI0029072968|nr:DMT family transporter [Alisedimentitalea sp. MJ-SS2]MDU8929848.1 DMT family transporter [Alisedimentitalea sp. MJ-SS2]